jgi:hypothetical protein
MSLLQIEAASIFEGLSDADSLLGQSWQITKNTLYYGVKDEVG